MRIFGTTVPVRADVYTIGGLSAHADQAALLGWLGHFKQAPQRTFVVHGEQPTAELFAGHVAPTPRLEQCQRAARGTPAFRI